MEEKFKESLDQEQGDSVRPVESGAPLDEVDDVVDEIVTEEADKLMFAEDRARLRDFSPPEKKLTIAGKLKKYSRLWWENKRLRYGTLIGLFVFMSAAMLIPYSRYSVLNIFGVRVEASMVVVDAESGRPLKNILVSLQGNEARTDDDGYVSFQHLKQGGTLLKVDKKGFAPLEKVVTLGWGSNPLNEQSLLATGARYNFVLKDWQSSIVLKNAEATLGEAVGQADEEGKTEIVLGEVNDEDEVVLTADGYREEKVKLSDVTGDYFEVAMVPAKKHAFISNRDGVYDLFTIDVNGENEKLLLGATKKEREVPYILPHPQKDVIAFVSSRDGETNKGGYVLDGLFVVDTLNADTYKITRSEQVQVIGWAGDKLVYVAVIEGVSAGNSQRSKIVSFDYLTKERTELAASNYFNDVKLIDDSVYYAVSSYAVPRAQAKIFKTSLDGKNKQTLIDEQVWSIARKDYETLLFNTESNAWYEYLGTEAPVKLETQPTQQQTRIYAVNPSKTHASWIDLRDGKGVLLDYDISAKKESILLTASGITDPAYWLTDSHLIYRVSTSQETADYIVNRDGGAPSKIADVIGNRSRYFY